MLFQIDLGILSSLSDLISLISVPRTTLVNDTHIRCQIQHISHIGNTFPKHDIEFCFLKRRCDLILHHFDSGPVSDHFTTLLQGFNPSDIHPD